MVLGRFFSHKKETRGGPTRPRAFEQIVVHTPGSNQISSAAGLMLFSAAWPAPGYDRHPHHPPRTRPGKVGRTDTPNGGPCRFGSCRSTEADPASVALERSPVDMVRQSPLRQAAL